MSASSFQGSSLVLGVLPKLSPSHPSESTAGTVLFYSAVVLIVLRAALSQRSFVALEALSCSS